MNLFTISISFRYDRSSFNGLNAPMSQKYENFTSLLVVADDSEARLCPIQVKGRGQCISIDECAVNLTYVSDNENWHETSVDIMEA